MALDQEKWIEFSVEENVEDFRLDSYLVSKIEWLSKEHNISLLSRAKIQRLIKDNLIKVNGSVPKANTRLSKGDKIKIVCSETDLVTITPEYIPLKIIFEDEHILVLNKDPGVVVHPGAGETGPTLVHGLLYYFGLKATHLEKGQENHFRPGIVHRLDKDTSGLLVCAKTEGAHLDLSKQFQEKTSFREYLAILDGKMSESEIMVESYLARDPKSRLKFTSISLDKVKNHKTPGDQIHYKYAKSNFKKICTYQNRLTLVLIRLFTGRTHQIRVHAKDNLRLPVLGDPLYHRGTELPKEFPKEIRLLVKKLKRQMLHAARLDFCHPVTKKILTFTAPPPEDFEKIIELLSSLRDNPS